MARDTAREIRTLENAEADLFIQAGALEEIEAVLVERLANENISDLVAVVLDAVVANIRRDAEEIGNALNGARGKVA